MGPLRNQTWDCSLVRGKANLLTPGCGEGRGSVYCRRQTRSPGKLVLKTPKLPEGFRGSIFFFNISLFLFIYFWLCWVFVAARRLSLVVASGGYSSLWFAGFPLRWLLLLRSTGSRRVGFSSCGMWAQ